MKTMNAIRTHRRGGPEALVYEDAPIPALQPGDALVRVHAASISPAEFTWHIWETPDGRSRLPFIPSHEVSNELSRLIDAGVIRPIVEAVLPLSQSREAYERGIRDHPGGKLVLAVVGDDGGMSGERHG